MKRLVPVVAALACSFSEGIASSQQSALLTVYGPAARRQGENPSAQIVWLSVSSLARDSLYLRLFDADCGGEWDGRRGSWNTETLYELYPAPADSLGGAKLIADSLDLQRLGRPIARLTVGQNAVYDGRWVAMAGFLPSRGRVVGGEMSFMLIVRATTNDDANRFDVAVSGSSVAEVAVPSAKLWVYGASFYVATEQGQSAEARVFAPPGTRVVSVATADASRARVRIETPRRSGMIVTAPATGALAATPVPVQSDEERGADWAVTVVWTGTDYGDVYLRATGDADAPLPMWLPIGIGRTNARPSASFTTVFLGDCRSVLFDADGSSDPDGDQLTYEWDFGDGETGSGVRVTHAFASAGSYTARLAVQDPTGRVNNRDVASERVTVNHVPSAQIAVPERGAVGESLAFDASASQDPDGRIVAYEWDFGDGSLAAGARVRHRYDRPGRYQVRLIVQDNSASICQTASAEASVTINAAPVAKVVAGDRGSSGETLTFDGSGSVDTDGHLTSYEWDYRDGTTGRGPVVRHAFREPGLYRVRLVVRDNSATSSAEAADSVAVRINARPIAVAGDDRHVAVGDAIVFDGRRSRDPDGEIVSYRWDFGDGTGAETARAEHSYPTPGTYRARLSVRDNSATTSDTASAALSVLVNAPPVARAGGAQTVSASTVTFDGSGSRDPDGRIVRYEWDFGDGGTASGERVSHVYALPGNYRVVLSVTDDSGTRTATTRDTTTATINEFPIADMGWWRNVVAPGERLTFDASRSVDPDGEITSYAWDFGDGTKATDVRVDHVWQHPGRYQVRLTVKDNSESPLAVDTEEHAIAVNAPPVAVVGGEGIVAPGSETILDGSRSYDPDGEIARYVWDFGDGSPSAQGERVRHTYAQPGIYVVKLEVTDDAQVSNSVARSSLQVRVNAPPIARVGEDRSVCGTTVAFDGRGSQDPDGGSLSFGWRFGDGTQGAGAAVNHTFPGPGQYVVTLVVTDDSQTMNSSDSAVVTVAINGPPVANAGEDLTICLGEPVIFDGEGSRDPERGPLRYMWDFGDGAIGDGAHPTHLYERPGTYQVVLTTADNSDLPCNADTDVMLVTVGAPPEADAGEDVTACAGEPVAFNATKSSSACRPITSYRWDFADGHVGGGATVSHAYAVAGTYPVTLTVSTDRHGHCDNTDTDVVTVTIQETPKAQFSVPLVASLGEETTFDGRSSEGRGAQIVGYAWEFGDGGQAYEAVARHTYQRPGDYAVRLRVTTDAGERCRTDLCQQTVRVNAPPTAKIGPVKRLAVNEPFPFDGSGSQDTDGKIVEYHWDFGDSAEATGVSPVHGYAQSGRYRVVLRVYDETGVARNWAVDSVAVQVNASPVPVIEPVAGACVGQAVSFSGARSTDADGRIERYLWHFGDGTTGEGGSISHQYRSPGPHEATLTVYDNSGAANAWSSQTIRVHVSEPPVADAGPERVVCPGATITLDGRNSRGVGGPIASFVWSFDGGRSDTGAVVRRRYDAAGRHRVVLTVRDASGLPCGVATDTTFVTVNAPPVARFDADTTVFVGGAHDEVVFDASRSSDPDGSYLHCRWDLGDGTVLEGIRVRHTYGRPGRYTVTLTVTDPSRTECSVSVARFTVNARTRDRSTASSDRRSGE